MMAIPWVVIAVTRTVNSNRQEAPVRIPGTVMVRKPVTGVEAAWQVFPLTAMTG